MLIPKSFKHLSSQGYTVMPTIMPPVIASLLLLPRRRTPRRNKSLIQKLHTEFCGRSSRNLIVSAPDARLKFAPAKIIAVSISSPMRCHSFCRNVAPPFSVEQVGMEAPACFPTNENVFALLRVARIIFESQMANDAAPQEIDDLHRRLRNSSTS